MDDGGKPPAERAGPCSFLPALWPVAAEIRVVGVRGSIRGGHCGNEDGGVMQSPGWYVQLSSAKVYQLARSWSHWLHGPRGVEMLVDQATTLGYKQGRLRDKDLAHVPTSDAP